MIIVVALFGSLLAAGCTQRRRAVYTTVSDIDDVEAYCDDSSCDDDCTADDYPDRSFDDQGGL